MLLTIKDIAARLKVKDKTLYAWAAQGRIPTLKINGVIRFEPDAIDRWLQDCQMLTERSFPSAKRRRIKSARDVDHLIERAKRAVYTPRGETRPIASPFREEEANGSL